MMTSWHGGKGSKNRTKDQKKYSDNWDNIFGKNPVKKNMDQLHKPDTHQDKKKEQKKTACRKREPWWDRP
jgi:hypothetical protein